MNWQYDKPKTYQGCSHKLDAPQSTQTKYPVLGLGHAGVRVLRVGLEFASTGLRRQTCLIFAAKKLFVESRLDILSVPALQRWTSACPNTSDNPGVVRLS